LKTESGDRPYNDLEFYVFIRGNNWLNERRFGEALACLAHEFAPEAGVEWNSKLFRPQNCAAVRRACFIMISSWVIAGFLAAKNCLPVANIITMRETFPLSEAARLLMNRCSGLLFAAGKTSARSFHR